METLLATEKKPKKQKDVTKKSILVTKKMEPEVNRILQEIKDKIDQKPIGRKIKESEVLKLALRLITEEHMNELREVTYSSHDRLKLAHEEFVKTNGEATLDQFIEKLLKANTKNKTK